MEFLSKYKEGNDLGLTITKSSGVVTDTKEVISNDIFFDALNNYLEENRNYLREVLVEGFEVFIESIIKGMDDMFIKLPTGTGKTSLFCHLIKAIGKPSIVLVPRISLVKHTYKNLVGGDNKLGVGFTKKEVNTIYSLNKGTSVKQLEKIIEKNNFEFQGVLIVTYSSLNEIRKKDYELFEFLIDSVGFIVSDEAHRSLGKKTQETKKDLVGELEIIDEEEIEEEILYKLNGKIHLSLTATPNTIFKDVGDYSKLIYSKTLEEVEKMGYVIIPKQVSVGNAKLYIDNYNGKVKQSDLEGPLDKYLLEDGSFVYKEIANKYLDQRELNNGYLPGVGFCNTIKQVDFIVKYLNSIGIKAIKVTSDIDDSEVENYNIEKAEKLIINNKVDLIVTVMKLREGWDLPLLRASLNFTPTGSPTKSLQGTGRITRIVDNILRDYYLKQTNGKYIDKTVNNTIIIEPNTWEVIGTYRDEKIRTKKEELIESTIYLGENSDIKKTLISGSYLDMYKLGEISYEKLMELGIEISDTILLKDEVIDYFKNFKYTEEESYNYWFNLELYKARRIIIKGYKIDRFATLILGEDKKRSINTLPLFKELINTIFGKEKTEGIEEKEELSKEYIFNYFKNIKESEEESYNYWFNFTKNEILNLEIGGYKISSIATLSDYKSYKKISYPKLFKKFINYIFGKDQSEGIEFNEKEELSKEYIFNYFKNIKELEEESYNYWFNLGVNEILEIRVGGHGIVSISTISGWKNKTKCRHSKIICFKKFINYIFGKDQSEGIEFNEKEELSKEYVFNYFKNIKESEEEGYNYWFNLGVNEILEIRVGGHGIVSISTISGWKNKTKCNTLKVYCFKMFINFIFGKDEKYGIKEKVKKENIDKVIISNYFKTIKETENKSYEYLLGLDSIEISKIKIGGHGLNSIATIYGWSGVRIDYPNIFKKLIFEIFGKEIIKEDLMLEFKKDLENEGIYDMETLLDYGPDKFNLKFGRTQLTFFLGRVIKYASISILKEIGEILGYKEKTRQDYINELILELKEDGVYDMETLIEFGSEKFNKKYGFSRMTKVLGKSIGKVNIKTLKKIGKFLGFKEKTVYQAKKDFLELLKLDGITTYEQYLDIGVIKFRKKYGILKIRKILGKKIITEDFRQSEFEEFGKILKLKSEKDNLYKELKKEIKNDLKKIDITDTYFLVKSSPQYIQKEIGNIKIGKLLGKTIKSTLKIENLFEISKKIGFKSLEECFLDEIIKDGIIKNKEEIDDLENLISYGATNFKNKYGTKLIGLILGKKILTLSVNDFKELGKKLGFKEKK